MNFLIKIKMISKQLNLSNFSNKNILVTGGAGSIGTEISKQLLNYNPTKNYCFRSL